MKYIALIVFSFVSHLAMCQSVSLGDSHTAADQLVVSEYSVEWIIGELIVAPIHETNFITSSLMGSEIKFIVTGMAETNSMSSALQPFPNPFSRTLTITSQEQPLKDLLFDLKDVVGKSIVLPILHHDQEQVQFLTEGLASGVYFIQVRSPDNKLLTHFKIIRE
jgi:hypothetical protein